MARPRLATATIAAALAGLAGGAGAVVSLAVPAGAATPTSNPPPSQPQSSGPPFTTINSPGSNSVQRTATPVIAGTVQPPPPQGSQISVQITFTSKEGQPNPTPFTITAQPPSSGQQQDQWTFSAPVPTSSSLAWNGPYSVTAVATETDANNHSQRGQQSNPVDFAEGVKPQPPSGVSAAKNADQSAVTVSWQANPEPDIIGYDVQRASVNGSNWSTVTPSSHDTGTNYQDTSVQSGTDYQYQVIAVRKGAQQGQTISSDASRPASTTTPTGGPLFGPGGSVVNLPAAVQAATDPVAGLVHPGQGPGGPVTGSPTGGGYGNLPYNGQASLAEPGTPGAQDPRRPAGANLLRTALFVAAALILLAIAAHLIRMRRSLDNSLEAVGVDRWDRHAGGGAETAEVATVGTGRRGADDTRTMAAQRGGDDRSAITRAMTAQRRR